MKELGKDLVRRWLDGLDAKLAADAARAATAQHPTMIGDQREQVFKEALQEFLPPNLHVGKGKVISVDKEVSNQIDVVIFDTRFPRFKQGDNALYPVEGVIATIEVKSVLTAEELLKAWRNCLSVMMLNPTIVDEDLQEMKRFHKQLGKSEESAALAIDRALRPRTYVYAFDGMKQLTTFAEHLKQLLVQEGVHVFAEQAAIAPSVIASGGVVAIGWGDPFRIRPQGATPMPADGDVVLASFECDTRFGILASHLLWHIERRTTLLERSFGVRRVITSYLPFEAYINGAIHNREISITLSNAEAKYGQIATFCEEPRHD